MMAIKATPAVYICFRELEIDYALCELSLITDVLFERAQVETRLHNNFSKVAQRLMTQLEHGEKLLALLPACKDRPSCSSLIRRSQKCRVWKGKYSTQFLAQELIRLDLPNYLPNS